MPSFSSQPPSHSSPLVPFPRIDSTATVTSFSSSQNRFSTLEVHDLVYGERIDGETGATHDLERLYERDAVYSNPFITASSKGTITNIYALLMHVSHLHIPHPFPFISKPRIIRIWSELGEICESESFDGHRTNIITHTLHVSFLPTLSPLPPTRLQILTKLSYNEQGLITYHEDIFSLRDLLFSLWGPVPSWVIGWGLSAVGKLVRWREKSDVEGNALGLQLEMEKGSRRLVKGPNGIDED